MIGTFELSPLVALVSIDTARSIIGRPADEVVAMIEEGKWLRWSFDLSSTGRLRHLRVWRGSLLAWTLKQADAGDLAAVLESVVPSNRQRFRAGELAIRFSVSPDLISRLCEAGLMAGEVKEHCLWLEAASVRDFLAQRLIGAKFDLTRRESPTSRRDTQFPARRHGDPCTGLHGGNLAESHEPLKGAA